MKTKMTFDTSNLKKAFGDAYNKSKNLKPLLDDLGSDMKTKTDMRFKQSKDPNGKGWNSLSETTERKRREGRKSRSNKPLVDTGVLSSSIVEKQGKNWVAVGTNVKYAKTQQYGAKKGKYGRTKKGGPIPWGDVPARPFLGFSGNQYSLYRKKINKYFEIK